MQFTELQLHPALLNAISQQGYTEPTPIQAQAIPSCLLGRDILGSAQTGTGKTAAFALPTLHRLMTAPQGQATRQRLPRALVLVPTRELAVQVAESFGLYGKGSGLRTSVIYGGVRQGPQVQQLRAGVDVIVATPGRLMDLMEQRHVVLKGVETLILDEADRMLDMGFIRPIREIISHLPAQRQNMMFSATMADGVQKLANQILREPVRINVAPPVATAELINQAMYLVDSAAKTDLLLHILNEPTAQRIIVFTRTKHGASRLSDKLRRIGIASEAIHGNKSQSQRQRALDQFRRGNIRVLVATDVAARGIDVDGITHVVNFDIPNEPESYVHRIGRTGRAGATGIAISFCDRSERGYVRDIERTTRRPIPIVADHPFVGGAPRPTTSFAAPRGPRQDSYREARSSEGPSNQGPRRFHSKGPRNGGSRYGGGQGRVEAGR